MSFFKLLSIYILISTTLQAISDYKDCSEITKIPISGEITPDICTNTAMPHGSFCCYLKYTPVGGVPVQKCKSLEFDEANNEETYRQDFQIEDANSELVCAQITKEINNNCGAVGVTIPKSGINCTYARIPEQHCCYVQYKNTNTNEVLSVCRHYSKLIKETNDEEVMDDIEGINDNYEVVNIECSKSFIKYSLIVAVMIIISFI